MSLFIIIFMIHVTSFCSERKLNYLRKESTFPLISTAFVVVHNFDSLSFALKTIYLPSEFFIRA